MNRTNFISIFIFMIFVVFFNECTNHFPNNKIRFNDEPYLPLDWYLIGPFRDTNKQVSDSTYFTEDLKEFGVDEHNFNLSDLHKLDSNGINIRNISNKYLIDNFRNFVDTFNRKSNIYLFSTIFFKKEQEVYLMVDGAAAYRIEINNKVIYEERHKKSMRIKCDRFIKVKLNKGENKIFAKVNREFNYYAWGINIAFAQEKTAKRIFYSNFYRNFIVNPITNDSLFYYSGPNNIIKAEISGNGVQKEMPINKTFNQIYSGSIDVSSLKQGFYDVSLNSETDTFQQLIFIGNLLHYYENLIIEYEKRSLNENSKKEYSLLKDRINSLYNGYDNTSWRTRKSTNTNLVYWVKQLETFINDYSHYCNNLALKNYSPSRSDSSYDYAFYIDSNLQHNKQVPLIVIIPFEILEETFATSWYMSNYEQMWVDCKLARERGFALCYLYGKGPNYTMNGMEDEFKNVLESIEKEFPQVETDKVYLTGVCEGAARALILANSLPDRVKAIGLKTPTPYYLGIELNNISDIPLIVNHGIFDHVISKKEMQSYIKYLSDRVHTIKYNELNEGHESLSKDDRKSIFDYFLLYR